MPRHQTTREDAVDAIMETFRAHGVEGASLALLSKATGLGKSSLYHHFPAGKDDMAKATVERIGDLFAGSVLAALAVDAPPEARLAEAAGALDQFYEGGRDACFVELFGLPAGQEMVPGAAANLAKGLIEALKALALDAGVDDQTAYRRAEQAVVDLQGALIIARAIDDPSVFERFLERLPQTLLGHD